MKRLSWALKSAVFFGILLVLPLLTARADAMSGTGTQADPYVITTPADLAAMHNDLDAHYVLGADVNLAGFNHTPIGNELDGPFTGSLDGREHTISNLSLNMPQTKFVGLFGYMEGTVRGVKLSNVNVCGGRYVGGIAGNSGFGSSITDCHVLSGTVEGRYTKIDLHVGGIVGLCEGELSDCSNAAQVESGGATYNELFYTGGIIGTHSYAGGAVNGCTNTGTVFSTRNHNGSGAGGVVGCAKDAISLDTCKNLGAIDSYSTYVNGCGGIIGYACGPAAVQSCENKGHIGRNSPPRYSGGMIGYADPSVGIISFVGCKNSGRIEGYFAAGLSYDATSARACENTGYVEHSSGGYVYALVGNGSVSNDCKSVAIFCSMDGGKKFINRNETYQSSLSTNPSITSPNFRDTITWTSSNESVATVSQDGLVTGHDWGEATITVTTGGLGLTQSYTIVVAPELRLEPSELTLEGRESVQLAPVRMPEYEDSYTWRSNSSWASVDENGVVTGSAISDGYNAYATITVTSVKSGRTATCSVRVVSPRTPAQSVKLNQTVLRPVPGEVIQLTATVSPSDASDKTVTWESSDPAVATVSAVGAVRAVAPGQATITVRTANGLYDVCQVKVGPISSAAFVIPNSRGAVNTSFDTPIHLVKNPGISAFTLAVNYDAAKLTPTAVTAGDLLSGGTLSSNVGNDPNGELRVTWYSAENMTGDGPLFTVSWNAKGTTGSTPLTLTYDVTDICNDEKLEVRISKENGTAYILDRPVGDIYHDDLVNMKDIVYFARYFNELETLDSAQRLAADLFYDSNIDVKDLTALAQLLSENMPQAAQEQTAGAGSAPVLMASSEPFEIKLSDAVVTAGENVLLKATGSNCSGIAALRLRVNIPEGAEVISVNPIGLLEDSGTFAYNAQTGIITWYSDTDRELNGELFTVLLSSAADMALPNTVTLEYLEEDFFSSEDYAPIPVTVSGGLLSLPPYARLGAASVSGGQVTAQVDTNREEPMLLQAAFYENGKLVHFDLREVDTPGTYHLSAPQNVSGLQCKLFLLDEKTYQPLTGCKEVQTR